MIKTISERLKHIEIFYEDNIPYIKAVYELEDEEGIYEITINKIEIPLSAYHIPDVITECIGSPFCTTIISKPVITIPALNRLRVFPDGDGEVVTKELITSKVHEMTLEEIEKKLGYSVKIISKGEKKNGTC